MTYRLKKNFDRNKVLNTTIDNDFDKFSKNKVIPLGESSAFCAKEIPKKDKVIYGTIDDSKNDISELKMSQNGASPQKILIEKNF